MKAAPKNIKLCPSCPNKDLNVDNLPTFKFKKKEETTKQISVISKTKLNKKLKTLF